MQEFVIEVRRTLIHMLVWAAFVIVSAWTGGKTDLILGLILGITGSILYFLLMCYRVRKSADMAPEKAVTYMRVGWLIRLSFIVAILIVSLKVPSVNFLAAVVGLFSLQIILYGKAVITVVQGVLRNFILERKG